MRPIEALIPILLAIYILLPLITGRQNTRLVTVLPFLALILTGVHLLVEGYRWQMIPLYALTAIIALAAIRGFFRPSPQTFKRLSWPGAGLFGFLFLLAAATALPLLLPVPSIPAPGGSHQVGTQTWVLTDSSRRELYSGKDEPRKFMVQVWYPAAPGPNDLHAPWMKDAKTFGRAISQYLGMPGFFLDHLALSKTPAWQDAPLELSTDAYPIIVFSHGWNGFAAQNSSQALELASRGFVVLAVQHTYGAVVTVFPDDGVVYNNPSALPRGAPDDEYDAAARLLVKQWSGDISFILDVLENKGTDVPGSFWGAFDFSRIGVYGHSTGGGAAIQFCGTDARCKVLLAMDPFMTPVSEQVLEGGLSQPALFMFSQRWADDVDSKNNRLFNGFYSHLDQTTRVVAIQGTSHYDFSDLPALSPIAPQLGLKGPLNGKRVTEIVDTYLISFFESTLKDQPTELFDGLTIYPEVIDLH